MTHPFPTRRSSDLLNRPVAGLRVDGVDAPVDHAALVQEVLAEGFLRRRAEAVACVPAHARLLMGGVLTAASSRAARRGRARTARRCRPRRGNPAPGIRALAARSACSGNLPETGDVRVREE